VSGEEHIVILLAITLLILVNQVISDDWYGACLSPVYETVNNFRTLDETAFCSIVPYPKGDISIDLPQIVHAGNPNLTNAQLKLLEDYLLVSQGLPDFKASSHSDICRRLLTSRTHTERSIHNCPY